MEVIRQHLDAGRPLVSDFTVTRKRDGTTQHFGYTLLVPRYNTGLDQIVPKNSNRPEVELMSAEQLKEN